MQALKIFAAMLGAYAPLTALVGGRVYPLELPAPEGATTPLPAVVMRQPAPDVGLPTIDAAAGYQVRQVDVEAHLLAKTAPELDVLTSAVVGACDFQRGTFAELFVISVQPGRIGMPETDSARGVWYLPITFSMTYRR